jgi:hypothetical protein
VLRLFDPGTGEITPVVPARPGQLRIYVAAAGEPGGADPARAGVLRALLLADLARRVAQRHRLQVGAWHSDSLHAGSPGADGVDRDCAALNIHPLTPAPAPPGPVDLVISPPDAQPGAGAAARRLTAGPVRFAAGSAAGAGAPDAGGATVTGLIEQRELDPLALRLALLGQPYRAPAALTWDGLAAADQVLRQWRRSVAGWANSPSKPMCAQYVSDVTGAFDDDLDTPAALAALTALAADQELPAGSKFEAFAFLDHLLGLDLARDIGRW